MSDSQIAYTMSEIRTRRVGVWSLSWCWHILSILLKAGRGIGAVTRGLDAVFPTDDLGFGLETQCDSIYIFPILDAS